eukprot:s1465_g6.t1
MSSKAYAASQLKGFCGQGPGLPPLPGKRPSPPTGVPSPNGAYCGSIRRSHSATAIRHKGFVGGVADEVHLRHLVQQDEDLRGQITLASSLESLKEALRSLRLETGQTHGFLLGAATHWYSAAVVLPHADTEPRIYFFDSYNVPVVSLKTNEDIDQLVDELLTQSRSHSMERLKRDPYWAHRPKDHIEEAVEKGVEEWWKGVRKASMFWRHKPLEAPVRRELKRMDLFLVRDFLQLLLGWLRESG